MEERKPSCPLETEGNLTNRWSSRLRGRLKPRLQSRKELRPLGVIGGAAQLYVSTPQVEVRTGTSRHPPRRQSSTGGGCPTSSVSIPPGSTVTNTASLGRVITWSPKISGRGERDVGYSRLFYLDSACSHARAITTAHLKLHLFASLLISEEHSARDMGSD